MLDNFCIPGPASVPPPSSRRDFFQDKLQILEIDWLGEVIVKSSFNTALHVLVHPETGNGNPLQRLTFLRFLHQFVAAAIGQTNVTDHRVKSAAIENPQRLSRGFSRDHLMSILGKQTRK